MVSLIRGREVEVLRPVRATDAHGNAAPGPWEVEATVPNVLPQPGAASDGATADLAESRPDGSRVDMTFHFPKGYGRSLKGRRIRFAGREFRVVGDPQPYAEENTPCEWNLAVATEAVDG